MAGFKESEPRDEHGRWTFGGLASSIKSKFTGDVTGTSSLQQQNAVTVPKRAHRATGNPKGRPKTKSDEYGREVQRKEAAARARAQKLAPKVSEPKPYRGITGDKHTDRQILGVVGRTAATAATGAAAVGVAYGVNRLNQKLNGAGTSNASANVGSSGRDSVTGHPIYDPLMEAAAQLHRGPGRPRIHAPKPVPVAKFQIGYTHYRKTLG